MKHIKPFLLCLAMQAGVISFSQAQSPVGKNLHQVIGLWGENYTRLNDSQGLHLLQYKRLAGTDTLSDLLYFEGFTCVKEVSLRPVADQKRYTDSLNTKLTPAGFNSWRDKDSTFITLSTRDGFLDITSFSAAYYKKIAH